MRIRKSILVGTLVVFGLSFGLVACGESGGGSGDNDKKSDDDDDGDPTRAVADCYSLDVDGPGSPDSPGYHPNDCWVKIVRIDSSPSCSYDLRVTVSSVGGSPCASFSVRRDVTSIYDRTIACTDVSDGSGSSCQSNADVRWD